MAGAAPVSDAKSSPEVERLLDQGLIQYAIGNEEAALSYWREAAETDPSSARAADYLATLGGGQAPSAQEPAFDDERTEAMPAVSEENLAAVSVGNDEDSNSDSLAPPFGREVTFDDDESVRTDDIDVEPVVPDVDILLREAQAAEAEGRLEEALKHAEDALKRDPEREVTMELVASLRTRLKEVYLADLEPLERVPVLRATDASILELSLDPIGGFLISQIDGEITIEELLTILGTFDEFRVLGSLHFFLKSGIIELR